jgi:hypothetical protein
VIGSDIVVFGSNDADRRHDRRVVHDAGFERHDAERVPSFAPYLPRRRYFPPLEFRWAAVELIHREPLASQLKETVLSGLASCPDCN